MKRFVDNKLAFFAVALLFALALTWNVAHGANAFVGAHQMLAPNWEGVTALNHGPNTCPDCIVSSAERHGPNTCPDCVVSRG